MMVWLVIMWDIFFWILVCDLLFRVLVVLLKINIWGLVSRVWVIVICWCCLLERDVLFLDSMVLYFSGRVRIKLCVFVRLVVLMILFSEVVGWE